MTAYNDIIKPAVVLTVISLVVSVSLAFTFNATEPVIEQSKKNAADLSRTEVLKEADKFEEVKLQNAPEGVIDAYKAVNGAGYVFTTQYKGFGGPLKVMTGIKSDGKISAVKVIESSETPGLGTKVGEAEHISKFIGKDSKLQNVDAITGVTISSGALKGAVKVAFEAYNSITGKTSTESTIPGFTKITLQSKVEGLQVAYKSDDGAYYVFITEAKSSTGAMQVGTVLDKNGEIVQLEIISSSENPDIMAKVAQPDYLRKFYGKKESADDIETISGATESSKALKQAVNSSFAAYKIVKGA